MSVELRHLRAFIAVAEDKNFRRAADRLNIAQPALSRTIRDLEGLLGVRLFDRTTRMVTMTAAGIAFLPEARDVLEHVAAAIRVAHRVNEGDLGTISVGFNDFAINDALPKIVRDFRSRYPDVEVELRSMSSPDMAEALRKRRLDVGFLFGAHLVSNLEFQIVRREQLICLLPRGHKLAANSEINLASLAPEPFVLGAVNSWATFLDLVDSICMSAGFRPRVVQEAAHSDGIVNLVAAGVGVSIYVNARWLKTRHDVAVRPFREDMPSVASVVAWHPDLKSKTLQNFIAVVREVTSNMDAEPSKRSVQRRPDR
ncbi:MULTISPECIES: LysR substrate-binding domain-containing protein [unclassified Mesorhizobium]|uniref:LysR family transcriptional regulator n=1 Tax=unclassified Mesorhizobium TaxID=325217 RepID=UPI0015CDF211|nr:MULTISPECIES: LysR substrate-binding domain-containing protein [unclassified Mesorhizobium]